MQHKMNMKRECNLAATIQQMNDVNAGNENPRVGENIMVSDYAKFNEKHRKVMANER